MSSRHVSLARDVTESEVDYFWDRGWAYLPGLISTELATELLKRAKDHMGEDAASHEEREGRDYKDVTFFKDYHFVSKDDGRFREFVFDAALGRNAARLLGRDVPMRLASDSLAVKMPVTAAGGSEATDYHQDYPFNSLDRGWVVTWIALDEIPPERGSMRFHEGSHRLGSMGVGDGDGVPLVEKWERLKEFPLSEPLTLRPGDATVHSSLVVHGAPTNTTDDPRWVLIVSHYPSDARYTGQPSGAFAIKGVELEPFQVIDHVEFPIVYDPAI